jgi:hypothetical protein
MVNAGAPHGAISVRETVPNMGVIMPPYETNDGAG